MSIPQALMPPDQYREMAQAVLSNANALHEFLTACEACGLPVDERRATLRDQCTFCTNFLRNFFPDATPE
jgi:hypothetical protein